MVRKNLMEKRGNRLSRMTKMAVLIKKEVEGWGQRLRKSVEI